TGTKGWLALTESVASSTQSIEVTGVSISQKSAMLLKGGTLTLHAAIAPIAATNQNGPWSSDNAAVVSVSGGVITGTGAGTASVTVTTADGSKRASCSVIVFDADAGKSLGKTGNNGTVKLAAGKKLQLIPTFAIRKGWKIKSIKSSKKAVASVSGSGLVTARKAGTAKVTVPTKIGKTATITVKVAKSASSPSVPTTVSTEPETISFAVKGTVSMKARTTRKLQTVIYPTTASTTALTWKSSKPGVVYVDQEGNIYALKKGTCYIGVMTANGKFAKIKIKVV
ncbi:MAG: Ig domain-containing protein, partial [Clostridia bacterium]|nr:Ig domain-containing protein [Clostridia bacterium]